MHVTKRFSEQDEIEVRKRLPALFATLVIVAIAAGIEAYFFRGDTEHAVTVTLLYALAFALAFGPAFLMPAAVARHPFLYALSAALLILFVRAIGRASRSGFDSMLAFTVYDAVCFLPLAILLVLPLFKRTRLKLPSDR